MRALHPRCRSCRSLEPYSVVSGRLISYCSLESCSVVFSRLFSCACPKHENHRDSSGKSCKPLHVERPDLPPGATLGGLLPERGKRTRGVHAGGRQHARELKLMSSGIRKGTGILLLLLCSELSEYGHVLFCRVCTYSKTYQQEVSDCHCFKRYDVMFTFAYVVQRSRIHAGCVSIFIRQRCTHLVPRLTC